MHGYHIILQYIFITNIVLYKQGFIPKDSAKGYWADSVEPFEFGPPPYHPPWDRPDFGRIYSNMPDPPAESLQLVFFICFRLLWSETGYSVFCLYSWGASMSHPLSSELPYGFRWYLNHQDRGRSTWIIFLLKKVRLLTRLSEPEFEPGPLGVNRHQPLADWVHCGSRNPGVHWC